jgi:hypothetical protein
VQGEGGKAAEPIVVRHWRQEWRYQPESLLVYEGAETWATRAVPAEARRGAWSQQVLQVDDSPRYGALGAVRVPPAADCRRGGLAHAGRALHLAQADRRRGDACWRGLRAARPGL